MCTHALLLCHTFAVQDVPGVRKASVFLQDFSVEPVGELLPQLLSSSGFVLLADPSERTRHNRCCSHEISNSSTHRQHALSKHG